ncbi:unnamed protein product [Gordionus sp. m RMFG-2023]|uniref:BTB/POZ domain-containing protein KCTD5-like n=1 Tax=Gordionus sp. m RMFG-2023 TaxID=3053472 RepID=UPI0030E2512E
MDYSSNSIGNNITTSSQWVRLNVGGTLFITTKTTLSKHMDSFLYRLIKEDPNLSTDKDEMGSYLIDRDPTYFAPILNYLRHGKMIIDKNLSEEGVLEESEFYNITELVKLIKLRIQERNYKPIQNNVKHVYRVIHCQEDELTHTISSLSDGWKFKQLISVGSSYNYDGTNEYLCVVYRECPIGKYENEDFEFKHNHTKINMNSEPNSNGI